MKIQQLNFEILDSYFRETFPEYIFWDQWFFAEFANAIPLFPCGNILLVDNSHGLVLSYLLKKMASVHCNNVYFSMEAPHLYDFHNIEAVSMLNVTQIFK